MYSIIFIITILYHLVAITEQRNVEKIDLDHKQIEELQNLLKQLETQFKTDHEVHQKYASKPKNDIILGGNEILNLLLNQEDDSKADRSEEGVLKATEGKDCKSGRCGCSGTRCGIERAASSSDEVTKLLDSLEKTIDKDTAHKSHARCGLHGRCNKGRGNRDDDDSDDRPNLRDSSDHIKQQLTKYGKKYKLNKELDAIVLDSANVNDALNALNKHCKYAKCKLIDYSKSVDNDISREGDVNAVILDLTHLPDGNDLAKHLSDALLKTNKPDINLKNYLTPDDLDKFYQDYKKNLINEVLNYLKDKNGRRDAIQRLSAKQKRMIENVRLVLLKDGIGLNNKQVVNQIERILFGKHSPTKVMAHSENNNIIYVPKYLYDRVSKPKKQTHLRAQKRLLPLTLKQRNRLQNKPVHLWRRKSHNVEDYGVPFDLEVQGLGQVNP